MRMTLTGMAALILIGVTLVGVAIGRYPWLRMNRATIALVGATALILSGAISLDEAYAALDLNTILLLFAMMLINVNLRLAGFFELVTARVVRLARSPRRLLGILILVSGVLSAIFLNDTIVLMFTPLVLEITRTLRRDPIPYLVGLVSAANIGSTATITGNPQNMIIGIASQIPFIEFTGALAPVASAGLVIAWGVLVVVYRSEFSAARFEQAPQFEPTLYRPLLWKSMLASGLMLLAFILGLPIPLAALSAAALLLITRRLKPQRVFREMDWGLLVFFSGLFIVTGAIETAGLSQGLFAILLPVAEQGVAALTGVAVVLSNLVSNVPAALLFRPLVPGFPDPQRTWLTLAMATTLAGNLTLLGSVANLIVAETARNRGVQLTFVEYLKAGVPITVGTLLVGILWMGTR
jgi:Na+/H+ antiporter NhaD/arsenite permease-like protein